MCCQIVSSSEVLWLFFFQFSFQQSTAQCTSTQTVTDHIVIVKIGSRKKLPSSPCDIRPCSPSPPGAAVIAAAETDFDQTDFGQFKCFTVAFFLKKTKTTTKIKHRRIRTRQAPKGGAPKGGAPKGGAPKGGAPKGGAPKGGAPKGGAQRVGPRRVGPRGWGPEGGPLSQVLGFGVSGFRIWPKTRRHPERHKQSENGGEKGKKKVRILGPHPFGVHPSGPRRVFVLLCSFFSSCYFCFFQKEGQQIEKHQFWPKLAMTMAAHQAEEQSTVQGLDSWMAAWVMCALSCFDSFLPWTA